jgi:hypothetical protein
MPNKSFISFRISSSIWLNNRFFEELLDILDEYPGITDDLVFFTADTHAPLPIDKIRERAGVLADRLALTRGRGYGAGINVLATIGHHPENLANSLSDDYGHMINIRGEEAQGVLCPNDERARDYIKQLYEIIASCDPDHIWIDDDIRFAHMPISYGCFCDRCLSIFESESDRYTRESLNKAFSEESDAALTLRRLWLQHNRETIDRLFRLIENKVHSIKPGMPLGFMTGDRFYESYDFDRWAKTLSGDANDVYWRPGGGFYSDDRMSEMAGKSHDIGRQVSVLPADVIRIQAEIESFPHQPLKKSAHATALEAASYIASGCTGAAFNVLNAGYNSQAESYLHQYETILKKISDTRPFYDLLASALGRSSPQGIYTGWNKDSFVTGKGDWLNCDHSGTGPHANEILELGLPAAYSLENAQVTLLTGDSPLSMNKEMIESILSRGVYMDAEAVECLNSLGYGDLTGFDLDGYITQDGIEELTDHPLNIDLAHSTRDCRQSFLFWLRPVAKLYPATDSSEVLARTVDYSGSVLSHCCMGVFENSLGGRICVAGYYPWSFLQDYPKSSQIKSVMRWLSEDSVPAYVSSYHKVNLWSRQTSDGRNAVVLTNSRHDPVDDLSIMLHTKSEIISVFDMSCEETIISASKTFGNYKEFVMPPVDPWQIRLLIESSYRGE